MQRNIVYTAERFEKISGNDFNVTEFYCPVSLLPMTPLHVESSTES